MKYRYKTKPYRHQHRALQQLLRQEFGGALLMDPRTGKSKVTVDWLSVLNVQGRMDTALIICPNRVLGTWVSELLHHCPRHVHVTVWDAVERQKGVPARPPGYQLYVLLTNFEAFATPGPKTRSGRRSKRGGRFKHRELIRRWLDMSSLPAACVVDESHKLKSPSGKASNMIVNMGREFEYRVILTGTPLTKADRAFDIYMQWQFLNPDRFSHLPTVTQFKEHFGQWTQRNGYPQFLRPRNMSELHAGIAQDSFIIRRDQCFDLPPREDIVEFVDLGPSRAVYEEMAEEMVAKIKEGIFTEASIRLVQNLRLGQITSGFATTTEGTIERLGYEKADKLAEILDVEFERDQKIVVAARWKPDLDLIAAMVSERGVPVWSIRGGLTRAETDEAIVAFRNYGGAGAIVVQPAAASLGIDLSTAAHMVWYSHTPSWVNFTQCCDRIALSRTSTTFTHLVARKSVDEVLLDTLAGDGDVARAIMTSPDELLSGHVLDLDDQSKFKGAFQPRRK